MSPELSNLESLQDQLLSSLDIVLRQGKPLSDQLMGLIAEQLDWISNSIEQLRQPTQPPTPTAPVGAPPPADAQLLWMLAGQQEEPFISYLREYPSPATQDLLQNPSELSRVIDYLSHHMPPGQQPVVDGIQHADLQSSNVWGTAYNQKTGQLKVRFQGGAEYEYDGVPANIYRALAKGNASARTRGKNRYGEWWPNKNPSLGAALNQYIKAGGFPYRRVN